MIFTSIYMYKYWTYTELSKGIDRFYIKMASKSHIWGKLSRVSFVPVLFKSWDSLVYVLGLLEFSIQI